MRQAAAALALLAFALPALAQPRIQKPGTRTRTAVSNAEDDETEVDIATLAVDIGHYDHKRVHTSGVLELLGTRGAPAPGGMEYYELRSRHSNVSLLFIPGYGLLRDDLRQVLGSELQVKGVVRMLRAGGESVYDAQNPDLPPLPKQSPELPRVSITVLTLSMSGKPRESMDGQGFA